MCAFLYSLGPLHVNITLKPVLPPPHPQLPINPPIHTTEPLKQVSNLSCFFCFQFELPNPTECRNDESFCGDDPDKYPFEEINVSINYNYYNLSVFSNCTHDLIQVGQIWAACCKNKYTCKDGSPTVPGIS